MALSPIPPSLKASFDGVVIMSLGVEGYTWGGVWGMHHELGYGELAAIRAMANVPR